MLVSIVSSGIASCISCVMLSVSLFDSEMCSPHDLDARRQFLSGFRRLPDRVAVRTVNRLVETRVPGHVIDFLRGRSHNLRLPAVRLNLESASAVEEHLRLALGLDVG